MGTILLVEDVAIIREPMAATLQLLGYTPVCASGAREAVNHLRTLTPQLILLDLAMPQMEAIAFLRYVRADPRFVKLPVILLTAVTDRERIIEAVKVGIQDCILKSRFSTKELAAKIQKYVKGATAKPLGVATSGAKPSQPNVQPPVLPRAMPPVTSSAALLASPPALTPASTSGAPTRPPARLVSAGAEPGANIPQLLTREQSLERASKAMEVQTLSGVMAQVITLAASPHSDASALASLISRDAVLSAKVLQAANSSAYAVGGSTVLDIHGAVRRVGFSTVRNIATTLGIYDSMPSDGGAELNFVRCWQHSLAVATLCEQLVQQSDTPDEASIAYLVGLCHDLGEVLCHSHFQSEYARVLEYEQSTGQRRDVVELAMLGVTHHDLITLILERIGLPDNIRQPIEAFHAPAGAHAKESRMTLVLRLADTYASGMMLGTSGGCEVRSFTRAECKCAVGKEEPVAPAAEKFRADILAQTLTLARLSRSVERALLAPLFPRSRKRLWIARDPGLSRFDPVGTLIDSLATTQVHDRLPSAQESGDVDKVIVLTRTAGVPHFAADDVNRLALAKPCLWLVGNPEGSGPAARTWPITAARLAEFTAKSDAKREAGQAA